MSAPAVSVVIPTWNGADLLLDALASLETQRFRDFEVIVVDNGSTDGTEARVEERHPGTRFVRFEENRGFAAAVNAGIRAAGGEVIVLMNNDTEADPGWLEALVAALDAYPDVGSCASKMLRHDDRTRIDAAGDKMSLRADQIGHLEPDGPWYDEYRYVLSACAGAAAYRRGVFDRAGLFDERFQSYLEDVDLGIRAQLTGFRCLYVPDAVIYHIGSATASRMSEFKLFLLLRNSLFLFFQYMPLRTILRFGPYMSIWPVHHAIWAGEPIRIALRAMAGFVRHLPAVLGRRRWVRSHRRISPSEFVGLLAPPLGPRGWSDPAPPPGAGG